MCRFIVFQTGFVFRINNNADKMQPGDEIIFKSLDFVTANSGTCICEILHHPCRRKSSHMKSPKWLEGVNSLIKNSTKH